MILDWLLHLRKDINGTNGKIWVKSMNLIAGLLMVYFLIWIIIWKVKVLVTQSSPTLCNPMDCSLPGSSVHGILQARILEWVTIPFSRGSSQPRDHTCISWVSCIGRGILLPLHHLGSQSFQRLTWFRKQNIKHMCLYIYTFDEAATTGQMLV